MEIVLTVIFVVAIAGFILGFLVGIGGGLRDDKGINSKK